MPLKILIADDHPMARKGTALFVKSILPESVICEAGEGIEVIKLASREKIGLYVLDYRMPGMDGYVLSHELLKRDPIAKIIVLTSYTSTELALSLFDIGVKGFMTKNCSLKEFEICLKKVLNSGYHFQAGVDVVDNLTSVEEIPSVQFSLNELKLTKSLASGMTTQQIADHSGLSPKSIETYRLRLFAKAQVKNTSELISYMYRIGQLEI